MNLEDKKDPTRLTFSDYRSADKPSKETFERLRVEMLALQKTYMAGAATVEELTRYRELRDYLFETMFHE